MLNLDAIVDKTFEIQLDGKTLSVREITHAQFKELIEIESIKDNKKAMDRQGKFLLDVLNNNKEGTKVTEKQLDELPHVAINTLWGAITLNAMRTVTDPN